MTPDNLRGKASPGSPVFQPPRPTSVPAKSSHQTVNQSSMAPNNTPNPALPPSVFKPPPTPAPLWASHPPINVNVDPSSQAHNKLPEGLGPIYNLNFDVINLIVDQVSRHLIKTPCERCSAEMCTCYGHDKKSSLAPLGTRAIAQDVSTLAALNRTCKLFQAATTKKLYQCPQTSTRQGTWLLLRTLIANPKLGELVEFLALGQWKEPSSSSKPALLPSSESEPESESESTETPPPPPSWEMTPSKFIPKEVIAHFKSKVAAHFLTNFLNDMKIHDWNIISAFRNRTITHTDALTLQYSVPIDMLMSLCPNLVTLETKENTSHSGLNGHYGTFPTPDQFHFANLKSLKIWPGERDDNMTQRGQGIYPFLTRMIRLAPNIETLTLSGTFGTGTIQRQHETNPADPFTTIPTKPYPNLIDPTRLAGFLSNLKRCHITNITSHKDTRKNAILLACATQSLEFLSLKYAPACRKVNPVQTVNSIVYNLPNTGYKLREIELDVTECPRNKRLKGRNETKMAQDYLVQKARDQLEQHWGIRLIWKA